MKFILCFSLFVGVLGAPKHTELNVEDFFAKFDTEITLQEARKFDFSNKKNFAPGIYPTCDRFRYFSGPKDLCGGSGSNLKEKYSSHFDCQEQRCTQPSHYGSTKCRKMVKLFKPFYHSGVECKLSKQSCPAMQAMEWWHSSFHRPDVMINCECQTVWCIHDIFTIYEENGKLYKGTVTVKTPCKCDCRKKLEGWASGKK